MRSFTSWLVVSLILLGTGVALAGKGVVIGRSRPELTTAGEMPGTWYYHSAPLDFAFFVREGAGGLELKVQWHGRSGERYETDWEGKASYVHRGFPANVRFALDREATTPDAMVGTYEKRFELEDGDFTFEGGPFRLERAGDGERLVWSFHPYRRVRVTAGEEETGESDEVFYILRKASHRVVVWADIPW